VAYVRGKAQPLNIAVLQTQIRDLLNERASLKRTINALSSQVQALNAVPVNTRRAEPVCGTYSGYQKHIRDKVTPCFACKAARAEYTRNYRRLKAVA
jgi:hypothetical protein